MKPQHMNEPVPVLTQQRAPGAHCAPGAADRLAPRSQRQALPRARRGCSVAELTGSVPSCEMFPLPLHLLQGQHAGVLQAGSSEPQLLLVPLRVLAREGGR